MSEYERLKRQRCDIESRHKLEAETALEESNSELALANIELSNLRAQLQREKERANTNAESCEKLRIDIGEMALVVEQQERELAEEKERADAAEIEIARLGKLFDDLAKVTGWTVARCEQTGDSMIDWLKKASKFANKK